MFVRLRRLCLVALDLEPVVEDLIAVFDIEVCHRDPAVAKYGLHNAVLPIGNSFVEIVAPAKDNTAPVGISIVGRGTVVIWSFSIQTNWTAGRNTLTLSAFASRHTWRRRGIVDCNCIPRRRRYSSRNQLVERRRGRRRCRNQGEQRR